MTSEALAARGVPHRIWIIPDTSGVKHEWHSGWYQGRPNARHTVSYILDDPTALAASPTVQAMLREAEALVWEAAARKVRARTAVFNVQKGQPAGFNAAETLRAASDALLAEAAALRNEKPLTEYERKVAQMKEDFPNGI